MPKKPSNVIVGNFNTRLDVSSECVLNAIKAEKPEYVFVISWPKDGRAEYYSNTSDMPVILTHLREFEHKFFSGDFDD